MTSAEPMVGRRVAGRYRILGEVGRGGMGVVWRAHDELLDVEVAVKQLLPQPGLTGEQRDWWVQFARREARAAARLRGHPNVVTVHDSVVDRGEPWIVMDYVVSTTLHEHVVERGPLPAAAAAQVGLAVLDALLAGARQGVLHQDVKPSNVLLAADGRVLLTDFGIASGVEGPAVEPRASFGTPAYCAPERLVGTSATVGADLFALGATLYFAVTGVAAFARPTIEEVQAAVASQEPSGDPRFGRLWPVVAGLLVKDPARRLSADSAEPLLRRAAGELRPDPVVLPDPVADPVASPDRVALPDPLALPDPQPPVDDDRTPVRLPATLLTSPPAWDDEPATSRPAARTVVAAALVTVVLAATVAAAVGWALGRAEGSPAGAPASTPATVGPSGPTAGPTTDLAVFLGAVPEGFHGRWEGSVDQADSFSFDVTVDLRGGPVGTVVGVAEYPSLGCSTELLLVSVADATIFVQELFTEVSLVCRALDPTRLSLEVDGSVTYAFDAGLDHGAGVGRLVRV